MAEISGVPTADIDNVDGFFTTQGGGGTASPTPTFTLESATSYFNNTVTITNGASYTNPQYKVVVTLNGAAVYSTLSTSETIAILDTTAANATARLVTVTAQEFGDFVESAEATDNYTKSAFSFRYWRVYGSSDGSTPSTGWIGIYNFRVYSGAGQTGTVYPENLTSDTSGEANGYFVDSDYEYSATYAKWKAFDSNLNSWHWTLSVPTAARNYAGFYFDPTIFSTLPTMSSVTFRNYSNPSANYAVIKASNTGAFAGEETTLASLALTKTETFNLG